MSENLKIPKDAGIRLIDDLRFVYYSHYTNFDDLLIARFNIKIKESSRFVGPDLLPNRPNWKILYETLATQPNMKWWREPPFSQLPRTKKVPVGLTALALIGKAVSRFLFAQSYDDFIRQRDQHFEVSHSKAKQMAYAEARVFGLSFVEVVKSRSLALKTMISASEAKRKYEIVCQGDYIDD